MVIVRVLSDRKRPKTSHLSRDLKICTVIGITLKNRILAGVKSAICEMTRSGPIFNAPSFSTRKIRRKIHSLKYRHVIHR